MRSFLAMLFVLVPAAALAIGLCLTPGTTPVTIDCDQIQPTEYPASLLGYSTEGDPCRNCSGWYDCCSWSSYGYNEHAYAWTISSSPTDPNQFSGALPLGTVDLYLWLDCSALDGAAGASFEFRIDDPSLEFTGLVPEWFVLNAGSPLSPEFAIGGCPQGPTRVATLTLTRSSTPVEPSTWGSVKALYR